VRVSEAGAELDDEFHALLDRELMVVRMTEQRLALDELHDEVGRAVVGHPRIMNIHPALLPAFPGVDGYGDTFRYGCKIGGCTVHFVDYGEDSGPIIGQRAYTISEDDTIKSVREKGLKLEWALYPECVKLFAEGRLKTVRMSYVLKRGEKTHRTVVRILPSQN